MDEYLTGVGQRVLVHRAARCSGRWCVVHNPMPGPWSEWPTLWRSDRDFFMERVCPHGVGHPAVEDLRSDPVHGCCGCPCTVEAWHKWTVEAHALLVQAVKHMDEVDAWLKERY